MMEKIEPFDLAKLLPTSLKKKGLKLLHYEGHRKGDEVHLSLRETRIMEGSYLPKAMAIFLTMIVNAKPEERLLLMHLIYEAGQGRDCHLVDLEGETLVRFPDQRGDPKHDLYVQVSVGPEGRKPSLKTRAKRKARTDRSDTKKRAPKGNA